jgi:hypothetical protein
MESELDWPSSVYIPGKKSEPDRLPLEKAKRLVPKAFFDGVPADHPTVRYGIALHDRGYFWEAHEVLEAVWKAAPKNGRDRIVLRALIQMANAGLKGALNLPKAQARLIGEVLAELRELAMREDAPVNRGFIADAIDAPGLAARLRETDGAEQHIELRSVLRCKKMQDSIDRR